MKFALTLMITIMVLTYYETAAKDMVEKEYEWAKREMDYLYVEGGIEYINGMLIQPDKFATICTRARKQQASLKSERYPDDFALFRIKIVNANDSDLWNLLRCPTAGEDIYVKRIAAGDTNTSFILYKKATAEGAPPGQGPTDGAGPSNV